MPYQKKYLPLIIGVGVAAGIFIGGKLGFNDSPDRLFSTNSKKDKLNRLIDYIEYDYVDKVNTDSIVDVTVNGILENLDPHSVYIPKEDMERVAEEMKGDFVGIGVSFYTYKDSIAVIRAIENGPSAKAGILGGDRIIMADGDSLYGDNFKDGDLVKKLKGPMHSKVKLKVYRKGEPNLLDITKISEELYFSIVSISSSFYIFEYKSIKMKIVFRRSQGLVEELEIDPTVNVLKSVMHSLQEIEQQLELIIQTSKDQEDKSYGEISIN